MEVRKEFEYAGQSGMLHLSYSETLNYVSVLNMKEFFSFVNISNRGQNSWNKLKLTLCGEYFEDSSVNINCIPSVTDISLPHIVFLPKLSLISTLTENLATSFSLILTVDQEQILAETFPVILLPYNQWVGLSHPEHLSSFVTPNDPAVNALSKDVAETIDEVFQLSQGIVGYRNGAEDVLTQVEAAFLALRDKQISYTQPPASWLDDGQRVRMPSEILSHQIATCLDLSLLCCSLFEQMGLMPCILIAKEHAMPAVWIRPTEMLDSVLVDIDEIQAIKEQLIVFESTMLTQRDADFADAVRAVKDVECLYLVDIHACRNKGCRPVFSPNVESSQEQNSPYVYDAAQIRGVSKPSGKIDDKIHVWEKKLLDLTLRNPLLNLTRGSHIQPLREDDIACVISKLKDGSLHELIVGKDPLKLIKALQRAENSVIKETGTDPLFLTLGTLKWYEEGSRVPRFAPIILVPVSIKKLSPNRYIVIRREEEPMINLTLIECLRQLFDIETEDFMPLPLGIDDMVLHETVLSSLKESIARKKDWEIIPESMLSILSFEKFVMWHDVHTGEKELSSHHIISSLAEGQMTWQQNDATELSAASLDRDTPPSSLCLAIDADSSQMEAVAESSRGSSFVLHGPPGTGKSQTITNIIANALHEGKRVLFVSQKKAALEVVQSRLEKIGLGCFSLELHSKKANKRQVLSQLENCINAAPLIAASSELQGPSTALFGSRKELISYVDALHIPFKDGLSLYDYIERYCSIEGPAISINYLDIKDLSWGQVEEISSLLSELDIVESIIGCHPSRHPFRALLPKDSSLASQKEIERLLDSLPEIISSAKKKESCIINKYFLHKVALDFALSSALWKQLSELCYVDVPEDIDGLNEMIQLWRYNKSKLLSWMQYSRRISTLRKYNCAPCIEDWYMKLAKSGRETSQAFIKGYCESISRWKISSDENLRFFEGRLFMQSIERYRALSEAYKGLVQKELCAHLAQRSMQARESLKQEFALLQKYIFSNARGASVRDIMASCRNIIGEIAPCVLMSPLSVAQFLELEQNLYDLVIFDEASQMPTCEAIGAIARGKSLIVVGDPKQLPPTSFFDRTSTSYSGTAIDDLDSILEDCIALNMPSRYLKWHYRSRHESLIAFSNYNFYDGRLVTFPSVDDRACKVSFRKIDGYYDFAKSRSNKAEAASIVKDVISRLEEAASEGRVPDSIGIIAFSKAQSTLIETMLSDELSRRGDLESQLSAMSEEIIVKNLESVQGDERDVILFSIGYGPNKQGNVSMNFGPLNNAGGERRLNVAVSRARKEMVVFSTLMPEMIDLQRTASKGVVYLKRFLEYARDGVLPIPYNLVSEREGSSIATQIVEMLESQGHECDVNVGRSDFRIDVAVRGEDNSYSLGIIIDSKGYRDTPCMRDREIVRPKVLKDLGWEIMRVWSVDWIQREGAISEEILSRLRSSQPSQTTLDCS